MSDADNSWDDFWAVVPAGGAGTRLWPLSRAASPKFLHDLTGSGRSLLQATADRLAPLVEDRLLVVTGRAHRDAVGRQLPDLRPGSLLAEPSARDSMAAIGLAAAVLERTDPDAVMGSFAADHVIVDPAPFLDAVRAAVRAAREGWLVTVGITPTHPSTAFGYIHLGDAVDGLAGVHRVQAFVEKPAPDVASAYVAAGHRWNAGMFVVRPGVLLDLLAEGDAAFAAALRDLAARLDDEPEALDDVLDEVWPTLPRIAVDHAVAEPAAAAGRVACVPAAFSWDDVGDFASLGDLLGPVGEARVLGDAALVRAHDATGLVVPGSGRVVAVLGLDDVVVVDTPDAVLVTTRARAQQVKDVVAGLKDDGAAHLT